MHINIKITEKFNTPFPYVIIKNSLKNPDLISLIKDFLQDKSKFQNIMSDIAGLLSEEPVFFKFIEICPTWKRFYNAVNSNKFADTLLRISQTWLKC